MQMQILGSAKKPISAIGLGCRPVRVAYRQRPGTGRIPYLEQNPAAAGLALSALEIAELGALFPPEAVAGGRYTDAEMAGIKCGMALVSITSQASLATHLRQSASLRLGHF